MQKHNFKILDIMLSIKRNFYKSETRIRIYATSAHCYGIFSLRPYEKKETNVTTLAKKKTNVKQTSLFPCPIEPVPGVQIVGMVQRDVSEKKKKKKRGWKRARGRVPSLFFSRSLTSRHTPPSERNRRRLHAHAG